jgi:hypothetical protein
MLGERLGGNCMTLGIIGPHDTLMDLYNCFTANPHTQRSEFDEPILRKMKELIKKRKREFEACRDDFVEAWSVGNWKTAKR